MASQPPRSRETQAVVWLDRDHADVFHVYPTDQAESVVRGKAQICVRHLPGGNGHSDDHYYHEVAHALSHARRILVVGPGTAKLSLLRHIVHHDPDIEGRIAAVETVEEPSSEALVRYAQTYLV